MVRIQDVPGLEENINVLLHKKPENLIIQKAAEELSELVAEIFKKLNKPEKANDDEIREEIADVKINLHLLWLLFNSKADHKDKLDEPAEYMKQIRHESNMLRYSQEDVVKKYLSGITKLLKYFVCYMYKKQTYLSYEKSLRKIYRAQLYLYGLEQIFSFNIEVLKSKAEKFDKSKDLKKYKNGEQ